MKKFFSFVMALTMTATLLCSSAFAARTALDDPGGFSSETDVQINRVGNIDHKYSVDIDFGAMEFTYTADDKVWNPTELNYDNTTDPDNVGWAGNGDITITN